MPSRRPNVHLQNLSDDTSVAILEQRQPYSAKLLFHRKITADNSANAGIHPAVAVASHQEHLAHLLEESLEALPLLDSNCDVPDSRKVVTSSSRGQWLQKQKPDFVSVTRGPGMTAALTTGLDTAKGLAIAWQVPLVGVNHMQAHALTPRLVHAMKCGKQEIGEKPAFPFLTLLVSGGHTLLVHSNSTCDHSILGSTTDIAIGDAIDKMARSIIPSEELAGKEIMYGRILERYAFGKDCADYQYTPPRSRSEEIAPRATRWEWSLPVPLSEGKKMDFSFSGLGSAVKRICDSKGSQMDRPERVELAREGMRVAFEHLAIRVIWSLRDLQRSGQEITHLVISGGVASNGFLKTMYALPSATLFECMSAYKFP